MKTFRVVHEIEVQAENEIEAAKMALEIIKDEDSTGHQFYVQEEDEKAKPIFSVDLDEVESEMTYVVEDYFPMLAT